MVENLSKTLTINDNRDILSICCFEHCNNKVFIKKYSLCKIHYRKQYYDKNNEKFSIYRKEYRESVNGKASIKMWELNNRSYYNKTPRVKEQKKKWEQDNTPYRVFRENLRRNKKNNATPNWVNKNEIKDIYLNRPKGYCVDHIIPLINKNVCGLNVPCNLQYLTKSDNSIKNNKFDGTYKNESWKKEK